MLKKRIYGIITIVFGTAFLGVFLAFLLLVLLPGFINNPAIVILTAILSTIVVVLFFISLIQWWNQVSELRTLRAQSLYNFGTDAFYFNLAVFEAKASYLRRRIGSHKQSQYILAFTGTSQDGANNENKRQAIGAFNGKIMAYLLDRFTKAKTLRNHVFCYSQGIFLVYCLGDDREKVLHLAEECAKDIYEMSDEKNLHILVMPYFGISEVEPKQELIEAIENAKLARNLSERNFEQITFYQNSFRKSLGQDDAKEIADALKNNEFVVYYQPKFNLKINRFTSSEALIRWQSPNRGLLGPGSFIPQAEQLGMIHEINTYVFEKVCQDLNENIRRGRKILPVSLNFSLFEFFSPDFLDTLLDTISKYNINPRYIEIEITETTSQSNTFLSVSIIKKLKERGIRVLMDDFGIGYSNIGNLSKIPFDTIKIDKSYVDNIASDTKAREIVACLIQLGKINGMEVVAEGADNLAQVEALKEAGCDTIQGFYYSKPLAKAEFDRFLLNNPFEQKEDEA